MKVAYTDGTEVEVVPTLSDRLGIERKGLGTIALLEREPLLYAARLAYAALQRGGTLNGTSFDDWADRVVDLSLDEPPDPTQPEPGADSDVS